MKEEWHCEISTAIGFNVTETKTIIFFLNWKIRVFLEKHVCISFKTIYKQNLQQNRLTVTPWCEVQKRDAVHTTADVYTSSRAKNDIKYQFMFLC